MAARVLNAGQFVRDVRRALYEHLTVVAAEWTAANNADFTVEEWAPALSGTGGAPRAVLAPTALLVSFGRIIETFPGPADLTEVGPVHRASIGGIEYDQYQYTADVEVQLIFWFATGNVTDLNIVRMVDEYMDLLGSTYNRAACSIPTEVFTVTLTDGTEVADTTLADLGFRHIRAEISFEPPPEDTTQYRITATLTVQVLKRESVIATE